MLRSEAIVTHHEAVATSHKGIATHSEAIARALFTPWPGGKLELHTQTAPPLT